VSIGWVKEDQGVSKGREQGTAAVRAGRRRAGYGTALVGLSCEPSGWGPPLPKKIMPGIDIVPTRAGLLIDLMVSLSGPLFTGNKKGFFSSFDASTNSVFSPSPKWLNGFCGIPGVDSC